MNIYYNRVAAALLAILAASAAVTSCSDNAADTTKQTELITETAAVSETVDPNDRSQIKDNLPDDLDYGGRVFSVFVPNSTEQIEYYMGLEEYAGEIVNDAVAARNLAVEERLNIQINAEPHNEVDGGAVKGALSKLLLAGDSTYDVYLGHQHGQAQLVPEGGLVDLYTLEYIDFSQPWWWTNYMKELELGNNSRYLAVGDYFLHTLMFTRTVYYNKELYARYYDNADGLYQTVLDGKWTLDKMAEIGREVYVDLNNNGQTDIDDQLGFITYLTYSSVDGFVYGTDIDFCKRTEDGGIELNMIQDDAVTLAEKLVGFFWQPGSLAGVNEWQRTYDVFRENRSMFIGNASLTDSVYLRDMKSDFGMLPYPKLDEDQAEYRSLVHDGALVGSVNGSSQNLDMVGATLEALCAETYRTVTPVWYETALKVKYSRDDISSQMIDLIHDSMTTNFIYAYNFTLSDIGMVYRTLVTNNKTDYVSAVEKITSKAEKDLEKLYNVFTENT